MLAELAAVGEIGERVVARKVHDALFGAVPPESDREGRKDRDDRGRQRPRIVAVSRGEPAGVVLLVGNGHNDLERRAGDRAARPSPGCSNRAAVIVAGPSPAPLGRRRRAKGFPIDRRTSRSGAQDSVVADEREAAAGAQIQFAIVASRRAASREMTTTPANWPALSVNLRANWMDHFPDARPMTGLLMKRKSSLDFRCAGNARGRRDTSAPADAEAPSSSP